MSEAELFVAQDLLGVCRGWQEVVSTQANLEQRVAAAHDAAEAVNVIYDRRDTPRKIIVRSELAVIALHERAAAVGVTYKDIVVAGHLGRVVPLVMKDYAALAWPIYDGRVLREPFIDEAPNDPGASEQFADQTDRTRRPVLLPVGFIECVLVAA